MIDTTAIAEMLATYKKYGWLLRRVLLTAPLRSALAPAVKDLFGSVPIVASDVDAVWFSRPPKAGPNAWEVRHLNTAPYALVEHIDEDSSDFEEQLASVEARLRAAVKRNS